MQFAPQELRQVSALAAGPMKTLYHRLADGTPDDDTRADAAAFLLHRLSELEHEPGELPATPAELVPWAEASAAEVHRRYADYLAERQAGGPRRYFRNRAHALHFLRSVAPTKLVDGSWLYGLVAHAPANPRLADLVRTYVEELGEGLPDKNHVVLYRQLLARYGLDPLDDLADALYEQGAIQLALGWNAEAFLPEVVGFNLAYEQLPLHLLVSAYELNELGLDPYYFTLHVTVDNGDTGHARRACQAVLDLLPRLDDGGAFWRRVQAGAKLANAGIGSTQVIGQFDTAAEALRVLANKARHGQGAHSDYCRVAGRRINDWLADPASMPQFVQALQQAGWIRLGEPAEASRFWGLLQGERAEMFGVFSPYELQVLHDWLRGDASADGLAYTEQAPAAQRRRPSFRALQRRATPVVATEADTLDPDLALLRARWQAGTAEQRSALVVQAMSPAQHWTPAGLEATRLYWQGLGA